MPRSSLRSPATGPLPGADPDGFLHETIGYDAQLIPLSRREDPWREPLGGPSPDDTPRTSCIKKNLYHVTEIPIEEFLSELEHSDAGVNNRSGYRGVRQVSSEGFSSRSGPKK